MGNKRRSPEEVDFTVLAPQSRTRATKGELEEICERMVSLAVALKPLSVRHLFYQLTVEDGSGVTLDKTDAIYRKVLRLKKQLCTGKAIPWNFFSDSSRVAYNIVGRVAHGSK